MVLMVIMPWGDKAVVEQNRCQGCCTQLPSMEDVLGVPNLYGSVVLMQWECDRGGRSAELTASAGIRARAGGAAEACTSFRDSGRTG